MKHDLTDTIVSIATAPGKGAVGILRISGKQALNLGQQIIQENDNLEPRKVYLKKFFLNNQQTIDTGLILYFKSPYSFTGEDIIELQCHGGPIILDLLLKRIVELGARIANPGEFSQRAFLNEKMDLAQAEAIADLIDAQTSQAAKNAHASLKGEFSSFIEKVSDNLLNLRIYVEAAMDFPDEDIDFIKDKQVTNKLESIIATLRQTLDKAKQGKILQEGLTVVLAGKPNAGKSTLLNALTGEETAIVTDIAGTTRDTLKERIQIDGLALNIIDTAGLRETQDKVEKVGIERAELAIENSDILIWLMSLTELSDADFQDIVQQREKLAAQYPQKTILIVLNKIDTISEQRITQLKQQQFYPISAKFHQGLDELKTAIKKVAGLEQTPEGLFSARQRHVDALEKTLHYLAQAEQQLQSSASGDLMAEDLKLAHELLGSITGHVTADDLLGHIFSSFCIGK